MSYLYDSKHVFCPTGSIIGGLFSQELSGWILADGIQRNNSDGIYNSLITLLIGTGTLNGTYTPPNLKGAFLRGADTNFNLKSFYNHKTQTHTHTASQTAHSHTNNTVSTATREGTNNVGLGGQNGVATCGEGTDNTSNELNLDYLAALVINEATPAITVNNSTQNIDNNESRPFNFGVNWYIKY